MTTPGSSPETTQPTATCSLGIDVGGTKVAAGLVTFPDGRLLFKKTIPTRAAAGGIAVLDDAATLATELARKAEATRLHIDGIGIGLCELVSPQGIISSGHTVDWRSLDVHPRFAGIAPTVLEADVRAAAAAESHLGAGRGRQSIAYITIGTGISSAWVHEGRVWPGSRGFAGTLASGSLGWMCPNCRATEDRSIEQIASGPAIERRWQEATGGAFLPARQIIDEAHSGNPIARQIIEQAAQAAATAVAGLVNTLDPEIIIVGGGLGSAPSLYWETLVRAARRHIWSDLHRDLPIVQASLGEDAGLIGAALKACNTVGTRSSSA